MSGGRFGVDNGEGHAFENFVAPDQLRAFCAAEGLTVDRVVSYHGFWTLFADEHLKGALPSAAYRVLEWLDKPLTDAEYGNGYFCLAHKTAP
jgi:hypothetical protein